MSFYNNVLFYFRFLILNKLFGETLSFILIVIFSSFDFWFVKNISGRIIVGLRWWNEVNEDGTEEWIFESDNEVKKSSIDTSIFWGSLYVTPIFWGIVFILKFVTLAWSDAMICFISMTLSGSNMIGYYKCSKEQSKKVNDFIMEKGTAGISKLVMGGMGFANKN